MDYFDLKRVVLALTYFLYLSNVYAMEPPSYLKIAHKIKETSGNTFSLLQNSKDPESTHFQVIMATMYRYGIDCQKDLQQAFTYFSLAAKKEDPEALYELGVMYEYGRGVRQDLKEAFNCYKLSAEKDHHHALLSVGYMYEYGRGVDKNSVKALVNFQRSVRKGNQDAQLILDILYRSKSENQKIWDDKLTADRGNLYKQIKLGWLYYKGETFQQNYKKSYLYYELASEQNNQAVEYALKDIIPERMKQQDTPTPILHDKFTTIKVLENYSPQTHIQEKKIAHNTGKLQPNVPEVRQDRKCIEDITSFHDLVLAADNGNRDAQKYVGKAFYYGEGVSRNTEKGANYIKRAADNGNSDCQLMLGDMHYHGWPGVEQDFEKAFKCYKLAADNGNIDAQYALAKMYFLGTGTQKNLEEALRNFKLANDAAHHEALYWLAYMFYHGLGTQQNKGAAINYLRYDVKEKDDIAQFFLSNILPLEANSSIEKERDLTRNLISSYHEFDEDENGVFYY